MQFLSDPECTTWHGHLLPCASEWQLCMFRHRIHVPSSRGCLVSWMPYAACALVHGWSLVGARAQETAGVILGLAAVSWVLPHGQKRKKKRPPGRKTSCFVCRARARSLSLTHLRTHLAHSLTGIGTDVRTDARTDAWTRGRAHAQTQARMRARRGAYRAWLECDGLLANRTQFALGQLEHPC